MKKLLCILGIFCLSILLFLPAVLRMFLPDKSLEPEEVSVKSSVLNCKNDYYITNTNYEGTNIKMIILKRMLPPEDNNLDDNNDNNLENQDNLENSDIKDYQENAIFDIDKIINTLKDNNELVYNRLDDSDVLQIEFGVYEHKDLDLNLVNQKIDDQKIYYENNGLTCTIREY